MKKIAFLTSYDYAHRGIHNNEANNPENSILAYQMALEQGFAIELDIQPLKDETFVCFHDKTLNRLTTLNGNLYNLASEDLESVTLANSTQQIPLLTDVLKLINGEVPLLIEIKSHKKYKNHLNNLVHLLDNYHGNFAVFSFDPKIVNWFKKNKPNYIRGQISSYFKENNKMPRLLKFLMKTLFFNKFTKPDFISYNIENLPNKYVDKAREKGLVVFGYTARNLSDYDKIKNIYDNVVFEDFIPKK